MGRHSLEERITQLEIQVRELQEIQRLNNATKDWRRTCGAFTGDEVMKQIFEEGRKIREKERKLARLAGRKKRPA